MIFFGLTEDGTKPKVRHDFRSPNPNFLLLRSRRLLAHARQSLHFQKIPRGLNINIFCENRHEASFYIKEQTQ